ncbi:MAG: bifunctional salicylyl-CoA 5-hydroxylase/oxidoreductase [Planctomycetota bacterium]|nr:bifunctional salicylyl-CoA 5-hydroxylase/oxidoreductase [Planctomycetota bacterium]
MKIAVVGGGPGGLYFAILMKKADPSHQIGVYERDAPDDTFGWGVVFSAATLGNFKEADPESYKAITESFAYWDDVETNFRGKSIRCGGNEFCGLGRKRLLNLLQERADNLGVEQFFKTEIKDLDRFADCDLIVVADGVKSRFRDQYADRFKPRIEWGTAKFIWLGSTRPFDGAFTFFVRENSDGFFTVHAYQFDEKHSTFIVECDEESWRNAGFEHKDWDETVAYLEDLFAEDLQGHKLLLNKPEWRNFPEVSCEHWYFDNVVLLGDAVHTAHFSIGSGTKLAMEDAICLATSFQEAGSLPQALAFYEEERKWFVERLQKTARQSQKWFEEIKQLREMEPERFTYSLMTRTLRITHASLWLRDKGYIESVNRWFASTVGAPEDTPPMFTPFRLRDMELANRLVCSPMCMYCADDGTVDDWHLVHLGSRAIGGAGLVITEMTDVSREARISPGCAGMYKPEHVVAWKRIVDFVHKWSKAKIGHQIAHAGRKGSTNLMWEGIDEPLSDGNWPIVSASPIRYFQNSQVPKEMDRADMDQVKADFVRATTMADEAGFDLLEIHLAHGYLLASFLSPLTNIRTDEYGGPIGNRMRYPLEVFAAVREVWPDHKPISVRVSAIDWKEGGQTIEDTIAVVRALTDLGLDLVDVSSGHTTPDEDPEYGRCYQVPFSDRIRKEAGIPTMTVGAISTHGEVNSILIQGSADLCVLARPHLYDPYFTLHAAAEQEHDDQYWPPQYGPGKPVPREKLRWFERRRLKKKKR